MEKKKGNTGYVGKGFEFNESERNKVKDFRKEISKAYDVGNDENDDDMNEDMIRNSKDKEEERKLQEEKRLLYLLERDPHARKAAVEAGN